MDMGQKVLTYVVANLTRWTTHYVLFRRLLDRKKPLHWAVALEQEAIVAAPVGAEKGSKGVKTAGVAKAMCAQIYSGEFWTRLEAVVDDIKSICYAVNINQSDKSQAGQVLLTFVGIYRHFSAHADCTIGNGMAK